MQSSKGAVDEVWRLIDSKPLYFLIQSKHKFIQKYFKLITEINTHWKQSIVAKRKKKLSINLV